MFGPRSVDMDAESESLPPCNDELPLKIPTALTPFEAGPFFSYDFHGQIDDAISALSSEASVKPSQRKRKRTGSKRETKLFKKKQAYSILFKHVIRKWSIRIQKQFDLTLRGWREKGISRSAFKIKLTRSLRKDVLGALFFPELAKDFEKMRQRMDKIMNYADNFNLEYDRLLFYQYKDRDGSIRVDYSLLKELIHCIDSSEDILDGFLFKKASKNLTISPKYLVLGSSSGGSTPNQQMQSFSGLGSAGNSKQIPTKDQLQEGFQLLKADLTKLHLYVQSIAAARPNRGSDRSQVGPSNTP